MRQTLRRSCDACARSKLRCDLQLPQCSRCQKRSPSKLICVYANAPLSSSLVVEATKFPDRQALMHDTAVENTSPSSTVLLVDPGAAAFDPFDSHPQTRLPRAYVQRLIHHFLSNIAFQYYPLDLRPASNPFVISWFPRALADPALFHVSLQTASLDLDLRARKGFTNSEILMADSVTLVRSKVEDASLAIEDETMNSVVTLAAIELGKGNTEVSRTHIEGVKSMVHMRGGIQQVKASSPLTARMVAWVSMIVMQHPQFMTQDEPGGSGDDISAPSQWYRAAQICDNYDLSMIVDPTINDILRRLRNLFHHPEQFALSTPEFHDLTCFVLHRLLSLDLTRAPQHGISQSVRVAIASYMLILHGPTYYSHAGLQCRLAEELRDHLDDSFGMMPSAHASLILWLISVGLVASKDTPSNPWFRAKAAESTHVLGVYDWNGLLNILETVLWKPKDHTELEFQSAWEPVWARDGT